MKLLNLRANASGTFITKWGGLWTPIPTFHFAFIRNVIDP